MCPKRCVHYENAPSRARLNSTSYKNIANLKKSKLEDNTQDPSARYIASKNEEVSEVRVSTVHFAFAVQNCSLLTEIWNRVTAQQSQRVGVPANKSEKLSLDPHPHMPRAKI